MHQVTQTLVIMFNSCVCVCCRLVCEVLQVHSPHSSANGAPAANGHTRPADGDTIVISDSDDESRAFQSPPTHMNGSVGQRSDVSLILCAEVIISSSSSCCCI